MAVELGFLEKVDDPERLTSPFFPSKVGGKPAWLDLRGLPHPERLACSVCGKPCVFLLQVYAPLPSNPRAFHRTVFIFMCRNASCHDSGETKAFKVFRSQLLKVNDFYEPPSSSDSESDQSGENDVLFAEKKRLASPCSLPGGEHHADSNSSSNKSSTGVEPASVADLSMEPCLEESAAVVSSVLNGHDAKKLSRELPTTAPRSGEEHDKGGGVGHTSQPAALCCVCGCRAPKKCGRCGRLSYCSREHQVHDWMNGHKRTCHPGGDNTANTTAKLGYDPSCGVLLHELEIVTEEEPSEVAGVGKKAERSEEERLRDYHKFVSGNYSDNEGGRGGGRDQASGRSEDVVKALEQSAKNDTQGDKFFRAFKRRVALEPEQARALRIVQRAFSYAACLPAGGAVRPWWAAPAAVTHRQACGREHPQVRLWGRAGV